MTAPLIASLLGLLFLIMGVAAFVPWVAPAAPLDAPYLQLNVAYAILFWAFPMNLAHDVLHLVLGAWGLLAGAGFKSAVLYLRTLVWISLVLAILGICPLLNTLFGAAPIYGWDVALSVVVLLIAAFGGYGRGSIAPDVAQASS
jgi:hypothetical protein